MTYHGTLVYLSGHGLHGPVEFLVILNALTAGLTIDLYRRSRRSSR